MSGNPGQQEWNNARWDQAVASSPDVAATGEDPDVSVLYRPGRLVARAASRRSGKANELLRRADRIDRGEGLDADVPAALEELGLELLAVDEDDAPEIARRAQDEAPDEIALDHVLVAGPQRWGGTPDEPAPAGPPAALAGVEPSAGEGISILVLDTGMVAGWAQPGNLTGDDDPLNEDLDPGRLDPPDGHGHFVAAIIGAYAPAARIEVRRLLSGPAGTASDSRLAAALRRCEGFDIVNLSCGGPSVGNTAPPALDAALAALAESTVVVAAAGNEGWTRPHWTAAHKRVVGVAALDEDEAELAPFSNRGGWVNCCARGTHIHGYFIDDSAGQFTPTGYLGGALWSGTSFAAPAVSAAIAVLASDGIGVREAAYRLTEDPAVNATSIPSAGRIVDPLKLP